MSSSISKTLRIFMKIRRQYRIDFEDWLCLAAFGLSWAFYGLSMALVIKGGLGKPLAAILSEGGKDKIRYNYRIQYACEMFYASTITTIKISILAMHWRLFPTYIMKVAYIILGGLTIMWWLAVILVTSFKCQPTGKTFDPYIDGDCINNGSFFPASGIPNIITDVGILVLAIYQVIRLHLPLMKRVGLSVVFMAGSCAIAASCVRLYYYCQVEIEASNGHSEEKTTNELNAVLWSVLETDLAIICSSLTAWGPLVSHVTSQLWSVLSASGGSKLSDKPLAITHTFRTFGGTIVHRLPVASVRKQSGNLVGQGNKTSHGQCHWFDRLSDDELLTLEGSAAVQRDVK
ncbi:hypothetical protein J7T55_000319 [Diaporthe amygdali]|uniref:uncharacterized protein n=1 Tax=Phomopsis amygdali TaxID=1214568 RepID=UPI0022FE0622|nr:uncharacterized protein J7T55_000319 [Diaporthe amygdali]KAJ0109394.1 hypothetical protein J7T55_000319 [Diaporthe amygdali]